MKNPVVIVGLGEIGGVFARGILKTGYSVCPIGRGTDLTKAHQEIPEPYAVFVCVGENDLHQVLEKIPGSWRDRLILVQNELLPRDWEVHGIKNPTVVSVWFEKKHPQDYKVLIPSPVFGPQAALVADALSSLNISCRILQNEEKLLFELVLKNLYILTINIAGLKTGGTVSELWVKHKTFASEVANDVLDIQFSLIGKELNRVKLIEAMLGAFDADPAHKCMGRSAPVRLKRVIAQADEAALAVKTLRAIKVENQ